MNQHVDDLLALYALGGLEPDELSQVETHLAICAACRAEAQRQAALVGLVASSVPAREPDPQLRARVLGRLAAQAAPPSALGRRQPSAAPADRPRSWLALPAWVPAALSLVLALLAGWNVYLTRNLDVLQRQVQASQGAVALISAPTAAEIALAGQGEFSNAGGSAYVDAQTQKVVLVVRQLEPLDPGRTYQAWIITAEGPVSAGLFQVTDSGWGMTWLERPFTPGSGIGVSREPEGGSQQPTEIVLLGGL